MTLFARSILAGAGALLADLEALALPVACLGCGTVLPPGREAGACCAVCRSRMRRLAPPSCGRCGQPRDPWESAGAVCGFCRDWPDAVTWAASAVWMRDGPAREMVHALKYGGWRVAAGAMADVLVQALGPRLRAVDLLVPVPLGARRLRERGYNQAAVLAGAVAARCGMRMDAGALGRARETRSQTALAPRQRWENVAGAFVARGKVEGLRVAIVDDVLTTGATLGACAAALAARGAEEVGVVSFARAAVPD